MSEKPLVNAPNDPPPVPMSDEPATDPGGKTNYPVVGSDDVIADHVKTNYPVVGSDDVIPDIVKTNYPVDGGE
jgi:hypothetical protein